MKGMLTTPHRYATLERQGLQLGQRHIRPPFHLAQKKASLCLDPPRAAVPALAVWRGPRPDPAKHELNGSR